MEIECLNSIYHLNSIYDRDPLFSVGLWRPRQKYCKYRKAPQQYLRPAQVAVTKILLCASLYAMWCNVGQCGLSLMLR